MEYSNNYLKTLKTLGVLWHYCRDEPDDNIRD